MADARSHILSLLTRYSERHPEQAAVAHAILSFVESTPDCAQREHLAGHLTGSAWVVSRDGSSALLLHHRKLNRWLQPGGHADGELDLLSVALREAQEESGLVDLVPESSQIFDVDIHEIPARGDVPTHLHYDVRFLFRAQSEALPTRNHESNDVVWIPLSEILTLTTEESVVRMARLSIQSHVEP